MTSDIFTSSPSIPVINAFYLRYFVSREPLQEQETVQVVVRLPFCLYVPSIVYRFPVPDTKGLVGLLTEKVWTSKAEGSTVLNIEKIAKGETVYLNDAYITTDEMGTNRPITSGPSGHNVEFDKDPTGYFRYTRITVEVDWKVPDGSDPYADDTKTSIDVIEGIALQVLDITNYIIDNYRVATGDGYIHRLQHLILEDIRIGIPNECSIRNPQAAMEKFTYKCGYHPYAFSTHGIRPAIVNKPQEIVEAFEKLISTGARPEASKLLELNAQASLDQRDSKLGVIESFLSLEVFVEQFYREQLGAKITQEEIDDLLTRDNNWRLRVRLGKLFKDHFSRSISDIDNRLWQEWCDAHDKRNALIHRNIEPSLDEAHRILELNHRIVQILDTLPNERQSNSVTAANNS